MRAAVVGIVGTIASFCVVYALCVHFGAGPGPAIMAAVLALTLGRHSAAERRGARLRLLMLPAVAASSAAVGWVLHVVPWVGAVLFVLAVASSVWLRQFGSRGAAVGRLIALPFIAILTVPAPPVAHGGAVLNIALIVAAGLIADGCVTLVRVVAERARFLATPAEPDVPPPAPRAGKDGELSVPTRMALQMGVAIALAFAIGLWLLPMHWSWVVLTAFIVCSGARGRGDAIYKGLLRLAGALTGTILAAALQHIWLPNGPGLAVAIFAMLFLGLWLREINYAYWAACITLVLALLQHSEGATGIALLGLRVEGIVIGALCAVAATWFVYPIRTESVIRRRIADVLAALDAQDFEALDRRVAEMKKVAPPVELHRSLFARRACEHPATWIAIVGELVAYPRARSPHDREITQAIRISRRAIGRRLTPEELEAAGASPIHGALERLREVLASDGRSDE